MTNSRDPERHCADLKPPPGSSPSSFSASVVSCSMVRPLLVVEENCQLRTSATWSHVATGGLVKKFTFCTASTHSD